MLKQLILLKIMVKIALSAGIKAFKENYDAYITMDCDYQHPIVKIKEFIEKWQDGFLTIGLRIDTKITHF